MKTMKLNYIGDKESEFMTQKPFTIIGRAVVSLYSLCLSRSLSTSDFRAGILAVLLLAGFTQLYVGLMLNTGSGGGGVGAYSLLTVLRNEEDSIR